MPEANQGAEFFENTPPFAMTAEQRQHYAVLLLDNRLGALLRQRYNSSLL